MRDRRNTYLDEDPFDWEVTGLDEMSELQEKCRASMSVLDIRDSLNNLIDLLDVCGGALLNEEVTSYDSNTKVANVLFSNVQKQLKHIEQELALQ